MKEIHQIQLEYSICEVVTSIYRYSGAWEHHSINTPSWVTTLRLLGVHVRWNWVVSKHGRSEHRVGTWLTWVYDKDQVWLERSATYNDFSSYRYTTRTAPSNWHVNKWV